MNKPHNEINFQVRDFSDKHYELIQSLDDIKHFNNIFNEDYDYYFATLEFGTRSFYGSYGVNLRNNVYYVGDLFV